ncbi:response regulator receiver protein [Permianibacter sp. IMCC34836]|uniref:response regulator receiver protein n=1 Tax=Permianibacter fluminis TaxID=2738515 RepID=UPI0015529D47|nr:response regulator receiver protein [Permianibacter fluminis]NQD35653.1 response regulator receiver protein [Permianibacter fluminis]
MKVTSRIFLSIVVAAITPMTSANAAEVWHSGKIKSIYPLANGSFVFTMTTNSPECTSASAAKQHFVQSGQNGMTADGVKNILAAAMAAAAQGKDISFAYDTATSSCFVNRMLVNY